MIPAQADGGEPVRTYTLCGADGQPYQSPTPGALGGHRRGRLYGRLDCPSALRAIARGHYVTQRVFFADEATAVAAGYRPCAVCLPADYARWKAEARKHHSMNPITEQDADSRSPLISPADLAAHADDLPLPRPHTGAELISLLGLLTGPRQRIETVAIGHSRDEDSRTAAQAFHDVWTARGGRVLTVVHWPETAASWLRAARRLTAETPDAWVIAASVPGFAQLARRLRTSTDFDPARTVAFASLNTSRLPTLAGPGTLSGLRGASADGGTWDVRGAWVTSYPPSEVNA
ncbi:Ada metal-binding domain-containing protein [Streptomyces sparsogenes]|uniref:Uncharacterized protein n=1 Tax=Streptomyces sparsogenes DSM 40356 TaxID=1331668 RepID=A0A1R1SC42_9ACTN|nr:Ada metal-binding domain-containing protein [Streptomyces sparsogenes]OMI35589.1 hypothetical protein SPAR_30506 [Streptomyces sparsogenes DSM 40356]